MKNPLADALTGLFLVLPNIRFPVPLDGAEAPGSLRHSAVG